MQKVKLFIGLTFDQGSHLCKKINGFRQRFDPHFFKNATTNMSLFAPFSIDVSDIDELVFELEDEIENFFYGHSSQSFMEFVGIDIMEQRKKALLYFKPSMKDDYQHLQESLHDLAQSYIHEKENKTKMGKSCLVMGRFFNESSLIDGVETLKREFDTPFKLGLRGISVFKKQNGEWRELVKLIDFETENADNRNFEFVINS